MRKGDWKLVVTEHSPDMLFNLKEDISEQTNLALKMPEKVAEMKKGYHRWVEGFERNPMWISNPSWSQYNRKLYEKEYELMQPKR